MYERTSLFVLGKIQCRSHPPRGAAPPAHVRSVAVWRSTLAGVEGLQLAGCLPSRGGSSLIGEILGMSFARHYSLSIQSKRKVTPRMFLSINSVCFYMLQLIFSSHYSYIPATFFLIMVGINVSAGGGSLVHMGKETSAQNYSWT